MPHLSPLSWALAPFIFWSLLLAFAASLWWSTTPSFPPFTANSSSLLSHWKWI